MRDKPKSGGIEAGFDSSRFRRHRGAVARADIGTLLLEQLGDSRFIRAAPAISN